ncbi:MAG: methyltransferase domain-containing protein [Clostridiaceae bacterium]|nr:methyltransferase domain-containing protein [Clostridiaceae bacterium]
MYGDFAYVYDLLTDDVGYSGWADYIESLFSKFCENKPRLVLDLACGTGSLTIELAKRGYDMIGFDISPDMLSCAMEKSSQMNLPVLWICQDMRSFELYGTVDAIVCCLDGLNYIKNSMDLTKVFSLAGNYLNPGGVFLFDLSTPYKLEKKIGDNLFYEIRDDIAYLWRNKYCRKDRILTLDLTFFIRQDGDLYRRIEEQQEQKAWDINEVIPIMEKSGLKFLDVFEAFTENPPVKTSQRYFFIARKK